MEINKEEIIKLLEPKCNGCDLPFALDLNLIADILINADNQFKEKEEKCRRTKKFPNCPKVPSISACKNNCGSWF
jgi:hypothetical protein